MKEEDIISKIKADGEFTVFWATENQHRATIIDKLVKEGIIVTEPQSYPFIKAKINE